MAATKPTDSRSLSNNASVIPNMDNVGKIWLENEKERR